MPGNYPSHFFGCYLLLSYKGGDGEKNSKRGRPEECRMPASMTRGMGKIGHRLS